MTRDEIVKALRAKGEKARLIAKAVEDGNRDFTEDERAELKAVLDECAKLRADLAKIDADAGKASDRKAADDALRAALAGLDGVEFNPNAGQKQHEYTGNVILPQRGKSLGQQFIEHAAYANLLKAAPNGRYSEVKGRVIQSEVAEFKSLITGGSDTSAGALVVNDNIGLQTGLELFQRPLNVMDLVTKGTTTSDTIEYQQVTGTTNNAATVPEATSSAAVGDGTGGTATAVTGGVKPESGMALGKQIANVRTFAHWIPATTRSLSDAGQIRTLIDAFLRYGLAEEIEDQMVSGNGTGENFTGLLNVGGTQAQPAVGTDVLATLRKGKTKVRTVGRSRPTAYLMNPEDWERVDLLKDDTGRYYFGGPAREGQPSVWGLPVVETEALPVGTSMVADFRKAIYWDREQASIQISNQHSDFFVRNLVAILAEERGAFGVIQPNAFVEITLPA